MTQTFNQTPIGTSGKPIPHAVVSTTKTSKELVTTSDKDAAYFRQLERYGIELNEPQIQAVRHHKGPLLTLAGAGSGKTSVLVCRTGYLISVRNVDPNQILLVTFSSKAASEMRERIARLPGIEERIAPKIQARTFHSLFLQFIRRQGIDQEILGETLKQHLILKLIMRNMGLQDSYQPENLLTLLSSYKMNLIAVEDLPERTSEDKELKQIFTAYEQWKTANSKIDFDDVLLLAYRLLKQDPSLLQSVQNRFEYVMNDEFQDTNYLQYELIQMIVKPHSNLMVVGDDDQTIYSFNGARSEFILDFDKVYPQARTITLDINYRSTTSIVGLGNEVIRHNLKRRPKTLQATKQSMNTPQYMRPSNGDHEAECILKHILDEVQQGLRQYGDYAILYRTTSHNRAILEQLVLQDIPYIDYGDGKMLYEHWLVRPVIDHLRLSLNRRDFEAMESVLPALYINRDKGMAYIRRQEAKQAKKGPLIHLLSYPEMKDFQIGKIKDRIELIRSLVAMKPLDAIKHIRISFYDAFIEANERSQLTEHKEMMKETLDELESSAKRFNSIPDFLVFIDDVTEKSHSKVRNRQDEQGNRIALMTIHKSKGLEFPSVFLLGASDGSLPHSSAIEADRMSQVKGKQKDTRRSIAAIEEERRLAYVAITRAQEELTISSPMYYRGSKVDISRFISSVFKEDKPSKPTESVSAWICTSPTCNAWARISSSKEAQLKSKECPLCKAQMSQGNKMIPK